MKAKENAVFSTTLQFCRNTNEITPETVIYGYAKLLTMDEASVCSLLSDSDMADLEKARKEMSNNKLDLDLLKSGLSLLFALLRPTDAEKKKRAEFIEFLEKTDPAPGSAEIIKKAIAASVIPLAKVFGTDKDMDDVFDYRQDLQDKAREQDELAKEAAEEKKEKKETSESSAKSEDKKDPGENPVRSDKKEEDGAAPKQNEDEEKDGAEGDEPVSDEDIIRQDFQKLSNQYKDLSSALLDVVKGQDAAVRKFVQGCFQGDVLKQTQRGKGPRSYFFFLGPPGVGKTYLAETAAEIFGRESRTFNMSEYSGHQAHEDLIGISKMYSGSKEGILVKFVRENPESVLIFDEIEKAHINVIRLFLQILSAGKLHNIYRDKDVSFADTIIIFTSNVGKDLYSDRSVNLTTLPERVIIDSIQSEKNAFGEPALPSEICSRIASGNAILFNHLSIRHLAEMVRTNFAKISEAMEKEYGWHLTYDEAMPLLFLYNRGGDIDARIASGQSNNFLKNELYELTRQLENRDGKAEGLTSIRFEIAWEDMEPELKRLFVNESKAEILVLGDENTGAAFKFDDARYTVYHAQSLEEARALLKHDVAAVFVDPFFGQVAENTNILSIADYNTEGIRFFHELMDTQTGLPVYMLEIGKEFREVDRKTFLQEGAASTLVLKSSNLESFKRQFEQIMKELYMEKENRAFTQRGWVIDYKTRQDISEKPGEIKIIFYDLKKRMAVDVASRGSILSEAERPNVRFDDVIGAKNAKEELKYFINYLRNPKRFLMEGGKPPKGVLLYGPPGTGKTMLARAMAGESDVAFLQTSASEFKNSLVGQSEQNIRDLFKRAKRYAPAIIFIDEIDAIGKQRTGRDTHTEGMLNALLTEMDGFSADNRRPVFVLAATNYGVGGEDNSGIAALDEALVRRFDNKIMVDLPNREERLRYIDLQVAKKKTDEVTEACKKNLAERTTGQSLAILQNVIDQAFRYATKEHRRMNDNDLLSALEDTLYGEKRESSPDYYKKVAVHEVGHAYVSYLSGDEPSYITIESRGNFGGYMQHANREETPEYTREDLIARIRTSLAGRAAEEVFFGKDRSLNTGASSDLENATRVAFLIVSRYGMEEDQLIVLSREEIMKSSLAKEYVTKVNDLLKQEMAETIEIIRSGKETIQRIADVLAAQNHLTGQEFKDLMEQK